MGAKAITAPPAHGPNPKGLMPGTCMGSACPQEGTCRPVPVHLPNCTVPPLPRGEWGLLLVETRELYALWGADFGRKEMQYVRAVLRGRCFLHARAE